MSTVGNQTTPSTAFFEEGLNTGNQAGSLFTMPTPGGLITAIHAYAATFSGTATPWLCIWNGSGALIASVLASSTVSAGSPSWVSGTLSTPIFVQGGASIFIGFACPNANGIYVEYDNGGSGIDWNLDTTPPGSIVSHTFVSNAKMGAYADFTQNEAHVNTGTSASPVWTAGPAYVWNGSSWVAGTPEAFNGSSWNVGS